MGTTLRRSFEPGKVLHQADQAGRDHLQQDPKVNPPEGRLPPLQTTTPGASSPPPGMGRVEINRLHLDSLDELVEAVPLLLGKLGQQGADLWAEAYNAKKKIDEAETKAYQRISSMQPKGKAPTVSFIERSIELDPSVQKAHLEYARIEAKRRKVEAMINALQAQRSFIPGLQGKQNYILQHGR